MSEPTVPLQVSDEIVEFIRSGNNNLVSTLDHLPCDIIRSLWLVQMMNLKTTRLEAKISHLLKQTPLNIKEVNRTKQLMLKYQLESECESKHLVSIVENHLDILNDDRVLNKLLSDKLPGWTSEAVESRWNDWREYKKKFIENRKANPEKNIFNDSFNDMNNQSNLKIKITLKKQNTKNPTTNIKTQLKHKKPVVKLNKVVKIEKNVKSTTTKSEMVVKKVQKEEIVEVPPPPPQPPVEVVQPVVENKVEERYCFCNGPSFGRMVACEYDKCSHEWFHFKCVGLTNEPTGLWFCSETCKTKFHDKSKKKKKRRRW